MSGRSAGRGMRLGAAVLLGLVLPFGSTALPAQDLAIVGATIHPVAGPSIERGTLLMRDGVIVAVGAYLDVPAGVRRIDGTGKVVTPGLFDASTQLGLVEISLESTTVDSRMSGDPVEAGFDVVDGLNPNSTLIPINRLGGLTTAASLPSGGLISGRGMVIDL